MKHDWRYAYRTPQGGLSGGDDCYLCLNCGDQTLMPSQEVEGCPNKPIDEGAKKDIATWKRLNQCFSQEKSKNQSDQK